MVRVFDTNVQTGVVLNTVPSPAHVGPTSTVEFPVTSSRGKLMVMYPVVETTSAGLMFIFIVAPFIPTISFAEELETIDAEVKEVASKPESLRDVP